MCAMKNGYVDWNDISGEKTKSASAETTFLWLTKTGKYTIRPIHKCIPVFKYFHQDSKGQWRNAVCEDPDTCTMRQKHPELNAPTEKYAIYVIDRADGKIKVLEAPKSVFVPFKKRFEATGKEPGHSKDGSDWIVEVEGSGQKKKYSSIYLEDTPLTTDEKEKIETEWQGDKQKLRKIYKAHTEEEIEKRLFGEWESKPSELKNDENKSSENTDNEFGNNDDNGNLSDNDGEESEEETLDIGW